MKNFRGQRLSSLIREELGKIILKELEFKNGGLMTITDVDITEELDHAVVNFSVIPSDKAKGILDILNKFRGRLQFMLQRKLEIKPMPQITFKIDHGLEHAAGVEKVLLEVEKEEKNS